MSDQSMKLHDVLLVVLFVCSLLVSHNGVGGSRSLSEEEDLELEKQVKLLNKPAVKTIQTDYGDIYDCVDFYKQPAFDHPLLKNHTYHYQMKPTSLLKRTRDQVSSNVSKPLYIGLKGRGCPVGTVPIRRTTKEDLIRERLASKIMPLAARFTGTHHAIARTRVDPNKKYMGAGAVLSIHNPHAQGGQYSAGQLKIQNGPDSIQAGWRVDPTLYGDTRTRLFIRVDAGQSHCFNTRCSGFVIVNTAIPLDLVFPQISQLGGPVYEVEIYIIRDQANGNWWLEVGPKNTQVGFWPKRIFSGLANLASYVEWGGEAFSSPGTLVPAMGSGALPYAENTKVVAYLRNIAVLNEGGQTVDPDNTEEFADTSILYAVKDEGNTRGTFGHLVLYGGPNNIS